MYCLLLFLTGCLNRKNSNIDDSAEASPPISVSVQLLDITRSSLPDNIKLTSSLEEQILDASATGNILVPGESQFKIQVEAPGYVTHQLIAMSGQENTSLVTFLATESISLGMYGMLNIEPNPEKGTLVVALDHPDLSPAAGAVAEIDSAHDGAFVVGNSWQPSFSNVVPSSAGFVTFPNVDPGPTHISITPPEGERCWFHEAGGEDATISVTAQDATVAFFMCE